ncbi:MAG: hydrogenase maturation protease, partial [Candidatus Bathyarchaeia archaeon]
MEIVRDADQICRKLSRFMAGSRKIALIGVGNLLRKDDGVGINILRKLRDRIGDKDQIIFIESHTTPENYFSFLEREKPSCILFIDAADAQLPPGTVFLADLDQVEEL